MWVGVRPSSGAASSARSVAPGLSRAPSPSFVAAPEDGRTPVVPARCAQKQVQYAPSRYQRRGPAIMSVMMRLVGAGGALRFVRVDQVSDAARELRNWT